MSGRPNNTTQASKYMYMYGVELSQARTQGKDHMYSWTQLRPREPIGAPHKRYWHSLLSSSSLAKLPRPLSTSDMLELQPELPEADLAL